MNLDIFNFTKMPKNDPIVLYTPEGKYWMETDDELVFNWIRCIIAENKLSGFTFKYKEEIHEIKPNGRIEPWPKGLMGANISLLTKLVGLMGKNKSDEKDND